jgi:hypothetical protein
MSVLQFGLNTKSNASVSMVMFAIIMQSRYAGQRHGRRAQRIGHRAQDPDQIARAKGEALQGARPKD